jgi:hypothetical protein
LSTSICRNCTKIYKRRNLILLTLSFPYHQPGIPTTSAICKKKVTVAAPNKDNIIALGTAFFASTISSDTSAADSNPKNMNA